jgi:hypothetical protein
MTNPNLPALTPSDLKALPAIDRALAPVSEAIDAARRECQAHPRLARVPALASILRCFAVELDDAHPADLLLAKGQAPAHDPADDDGDDYIDLTDEPTR